MYFELKPSFQKKITGANEPIEKVQYPCNVYEGNHVHSAELFRRVSGRYLVPQLCDYVN